MIKKRNDTTITLTDIETADAITHGGVFHADDVFATVLLHRLHPKWRFCRAAELPVPIPDKAIFYDIGGGEFDHHQANYSETRQNGVKYAAFGLLWRAFGTDLLCKQGVSFPETAFALFDEGLVSSVDAHDNGQWEKTDLPSITVSHLMADMNPLWNEEPDFDGAFLQAVEIATTIFDRELARCIAMAAAKEEIYATTKRVEQGVLVLPKYIPWQKEWLSGSNTREPIRRVIYPSLRSGFCISCVDRSENNLFPKSWAGLRDAELASATGAKSALFCHPGRFLCVAGSFEDARRIALHK